ncbi:MAG: phospho-sugar mutase [Bacteroidota bacterium]
MNSLEKAKFWLSQNIDQEIKDQIQHLIDNDPAELEESFYQDLEFGTGGLRGIMGVGSNRMNKYTVGMATQGLANYLKMNFEGEKISVAIAYDSRNNSRFFAETTAKVFAGNGITAYLFPDLRPTPELSFAIRELGCNGGVVVTASHNPREYNGYKAYWSDGAQLIAPHDVNVIDEVKKITDFDQIMVAESDELIKIIGSDFDQKYLDVIESLALDRDVIAKASDIKIAFTSIHGTAITMVPPALKQLGFKNVHIVEEQAEPDGDFPTVVYPNPEEAEALTLGLKLAESIDADILMATDPDADRVGIAIKNNKGEFVLMNGNQMASLLSYYILNTRKNTNNLNKNHFMVKTIVTTELIDKMCAAYNVPCYNTLTGFKYIATMIRELEGEMEFIGGGEESYGFMTSPVVRDKDAVAACTMLAEVTASAKAAGGNLWSVFEDIYLEYGVWLESLKSITIKGKAGKEEIEHMMKDFRTDPPKELGGSRVVKVIDYQSGKESDLVNHTDVDIDFPKSNVLQFITESGYKISARPSGTEPKIKFYFSVSQDIDSKDQIDTTREQLSAVIEQIKKELNLPE